MLQCVAVRCSVLQCVVVCCIEIDENKALHRVHNFANAQRFCDVSLLRDDEKSDCAVVDFEGVAILSYLQPDIDGNQALDRVHNLRCDVLQCVAVCCSVLQCVAVCCSVLQCAAM